MQPYYDADGVTIYHGDALEVLAILDARSADLIVADPPYFRVVDADWDDQWGADAQAFLDWLGTALDQLRRVGTDRATFATFCSHDMACGVETEMRRRFAFLNHIVWRKPAQGRLGKMDKESMRRFFPTSERIILAEQLRNPSGDLFRFIDHVNHQVAAEVYADIREQLVALRDRAGLTNREIDQALGKNGMSGHYFGASQWSLPTAEAWATISALLAERGVTAPPYDAIRREFDSRRQEFDSRRREFDSRAQHIELLSDVWSFLPPHTSERGGHPTQKPLALMLHIVEMMSRPGDVVLDPFMGTGTTLRAAKDAGRVAIGIEKEERWCEFAAQRLSQGVLPLHMGA